MAGSFGYEADHYEVGLACGERVLLPSVREQPRDDAVVTDGFSCREMIRQETDRQATALRAGAADGDRTKARPARQGPCPKRSTTARERTPAFPFPVAAAAGAIGAGVWWWAANRHRSR